MEIAPLQWISNTNIILFLDLNLDFSDLNFRDLNFSDLDFWDLNFWNLKFWDLDFRDLDFSDLGILDLELYHLQISNGRYCLLCTQRYVMISRTFKFKSYIFSQFASKQCLFVNVGCGLALRVGFLNWHSGYSCHP